ncbi:MULTISPECIES: DUF6404 family protein [Enterobacteriaceae]|uniref:DUF6404 family protein n=1 Tax=Raoultella lignicola TaxID=3040939 RepID=A0ABU9FGB3_9ENTR|nr:MULTISPECIES: DUF6404 family protein [Enterobacteriaceae]MRT47317.1 hypothetical protein [Raoultella sp. RIT712]QNK10259.1 hypothetical protein HF679_09860 [Enterobacter sp. JUb54]
MAFEEKKQKAIALMQEKNMWRSNYAPPLLRLLWNAGWKMPPPPFAPFWLNMVFFAGWFGPVWGLLMWFSGWRDQGHSVTYALYLSACSGMLFGFFMALFHAWRKRANNLPDWKQL